MKIHDFHLSYCSNIHPGETWDATFENLKIYIPEVKNRLKHKGSFGIGLRLSHEASLILQRPERMSEFQEWLKKSNSYVFTLNCFPYGGFHRTKVKENVHTPDWTTTERKDYSLRSFHILAQLLPEGMEGGISTSPLSYRHWFATEKAKNEAIDKSTSHLIEVVEELAKIHEETGKLLHLDLEPEPDGILENSDELVSFFQNWLLPKGKVALSEKLGISPVEAEKLIKTHIQACYDVCHFAIVYENPADTFQKLAAAGIQVGKIQISAALKVIIPDSNIERFTLSKRLEEFAESTYLHQVVARRKDGQFASYPDLPQAIEHLEKTKDLEWRIHFHVPVFLDNYGSFQSTQSDISLVLNQILSNPNITKHLEVETYTWEVLPEDTHQTLGESIARELSWVIGEMSPRPAR